VFSAAVRSGFYGLAIVGVLTSVVSIFFYLRVVVMMYMAEPAEGVPAPAPPARAAVVALALSVVAIFYLGVLPTQVLDIAARSIATIF
jgi:NADH-quinone oxidoreductase subunit N